MDVAQSCVHAVSLCLAFGGCHVGVVSPRRTCLHSITLLLMWSAPLQIGYVAAKQQAERKSGAEAWSMRIHDVLVELPYADFMQQYGREEVPFHRIAFFKHNGEVVW